MQDVGWKDSANPMLLGQWCYTLGGMQKNDSTIAMIRFMSGPWGRGLRIVGGAALWAIAIADGSWAWLLAIPGTMMLVSGIMNYCPAGLMLHKPANRSEFMASLKPTNLLEVKK